MPKLLERARQLMRLRHYGYSTGKTYARRRVFRYYRFCSESPQAVFLR